MAGLTKAQKAEAARYAGGGAGPTSPRVSSSPNTEGAAGDYASAITPGDKPTTEEKDYQSEHPWEREYVAQQTADFYNLTKTGGNVLTDAMARQWFDTNGQWPSHQELWDWPDFKEAAGGMASPLGLLPDRFYSNGGIWYNDGINLTLGMAADDPNFTRALRAGRYPFVPDSTLEGLGLFEPPSRGRGGGGGGGPAPFKLDRNSIKESVRNGWRAILLDEPDSVEGLADEYIDDAMQFRTEGGQLDLQTWITLKARETPRYSMLYNKKPRHLSEQDYLGGFVSTAAQFGLNQQTALREIEAGASAGVGLKGFQTRLQQGRPNFLNNQGTYSQKFAQQILQSGLAGS